MNNNKNNLIPPWEYAGRFLDKVFFAPRDEEDHPDHPYGIILVVLFLLLLFFGFNYWWFTAG